MFFLFFGFFHLQPKVVLCATTTATQQLLQLHLQSEIENKERVEEIRGVGKVCALKEITTNGRQRKT